ncbi:hypothetical protein QBC46DRAFT_364395 [Diplogelasinospora grovesii]|uniref:Uncharacterized protein n=1 Tax=Diplogelasinospora grovesii TaxID=303347 RepID=A0AAN6N685_9PEZI|nr:hypothetical protein QBC46DRAFT_364395 [Diplogelasinospora grovesii]
MQLLGLVALVGAIAVPNLGGEGGIQSLVSDEKPPSVASHVPKQAFTCVTGTTPTYGLTSEDCAYMASIGFAGLGRNSLTNNGLIWIGTDGPNVFTFINGAGYPIILIMWYAAPLDYQASFMNIRIPQISYSLPQTGDAVAISMVNDIAGAWAALEDYRTPLSSFGQIYNTFGEFSTGASATTDVSRLVNMGGSQMTIKTPAGCLSNLNTCAYECITGNSCGKTGTYQLVNCEGPGAEVGRDKDGNPTGGCQGWNYGGKIDVVFSKSSLYFLS